jgi:hypothetical protein
MGLLMDENVSQGPIIGLTGDIDPRAEEAYEAGRRQLTVYQYGEGIALYLNGIGVSLDSPVEAEIHREEPQRHNSCAQCPNTYGKL